MLDISLTLIFSAICWYCVNKELYEHAKDLDLKNQELYGKINEIRKKHRSELRKLLGGK